MTPTFRKRLRTSHFGNPFYSGNTTRLYSVIAAPSLVAINLEPMRLIIVQNMHCYSDALSLDFLYENN